MIKRIRRLAGLGLVFDDFTGDPATPPFKRYNVIFGWNGSGKSTLSTMFDAIAQPTKTAVRYECELADSSVLRTRNTCPNPIRVFNQDYIERNVNIVDGRANAISVLLGETSKDLQAQIQDDERLLYGGDEEHKSGQFGLVVQTEKLRTERSSIANARAQLFTDVARTIGVLLGGEASRGYRKPDAERDFSDVAASDLLPEDNVKSLLEATRRSSRPLLTTLEFSLPPAFANGSNPTTAAIIERISIDINRVLEDTVESAIIQRLAENRKIAEWVEQGLALHAEYASTNCEYCGQQLPRDRLTELAKHFNEADRELKSRIDRMVANLKQISNSLSSLRAPETSALYDEFSEVAERARDDLDRAIRLFTVSVEAAMGVLNEKRSHTTEPYLPIPHLTLDGVIGAMKNFNAVVNKHNGTTQEFQHMKQLAAETLKRHYLAELVQPVEEYDRRIALLDLVIADSTQRIRDAHDRMARNQAQVSSAHKGCDELNRHLALFLGHKELLFAAQPGRSEGEIAGYSIMRGHQPATRLSEGEKTAIALVYFIVHLNDGHFDALNGIIVVDDPISSLDSNSMYQAFSAIKNAVKDAHQVFTFTHNFEYLKLLINWTDSAARKDSEYFLITNTNVDGKRVAQISAIDSTLRVFKSEYHYLFKLLKKMRDDQDGTITKAYPVPNIARKLWETFLTFEVPNADSFFRKMDILKDEGIDPDKLDSIYKFINDQSHLTGGGFDPALVPGVKKAIINIFEVMQEAAPRHYRLLDSATQ